jgi:putative endonuclease
VATPRQRGNFWELKAKSFLNKKGLRTVERNYQVRTGEIDLIMMDGATLVFVEVRFREKESHGSGADSVTWAKQQRLIRAARHYLSRHPDQYSLHCRFDVVSIGLRDGRAFFDWIQNAFDLS